jgi:hypothetical protein
MPAAPFCNGSKLWFALEIKREAAIATKASVYLCVFVKETLYTDGIEQREAADTPPILQKMRAVHFWNESKLWVER